MDSMHVHMFRRRATPVYCLSGDASGWAIPTDAYPGDWFYVRAVELVPHEQRLAFDSDQAIAEIRERGYHLIPAPYPWL